MTETTPVWDDSHDASVARQPKHRRDDVPVDGVPGLTLEDLGENPDIETTR